MYGEYGEIKEEIIRQTYMESIVDNIPTIWWQDDKREESHYWKTYCLYEQSLLEIKNDALGKVPDSQEKDKISIHIVLGHLDVRATENNEFVWVGKISNTWSKNGTIEIFSWV